MRWTFLITGLLVLNWAVPVRSEMNVAGRAGGLLSGEAYHSAEFNYGSVVTAGLEFRFSEVVGIGVAAEWLRFDYKFAGKRIYSGDGPILLNTGTSGETLVLPTQSREVFHPELLGVTVRFSWFSSPHSWGTPYFLAAVGAYRATATPNELWYSFGPGAGVRFHAGPTSVGLEVQPMMVGYDTQPFLFVPVAVTLAL